MCIMRTCTESPEEVASCPSSGSRWSPSPTRCTPVRAMCKYIFLLSPKRFCGWYLTLLVGPLVCCSMRSPLSVECHIRRCLPSDLLQLLRQGHRMKRPEGCTQEMWVSVLSEVHNCWSHLLNSGFPWWKAAGAPCHHTGQHFPPLNTDLVAWFWPLTMFQKGWNNCKLQPSQN